ncbi:SixA phosphatase family protein [Vulcaniibacterium tengchongense]|uniref:Phosphohistidine phosphatase SixA n=1 Tax=Vulcaniibacterium tengchongense TaxID=1273429 RepID=A0A3N4VDU4_9GAMM|nr:phosphoglycerate mutase family protein [Vulcaniibacterium tengchongense]RPE81172.1 phosphohistidine phosphatase SixA [Vulcaniibacterium tengchongense]
MNAQPGPRARAWLAALALAATGCATAARPEAVDAAAAAPATTFVLVRHAEKARDGSDDPPLTEAGHARAARLARWLERAPLRAVYATDYRRTRQTAAPAAQRHRLPVLGYDAKRPPGEFAAELRRAHAGGTVLVVGHSNTVPALAAALCRCEVAPMSEAEYGRRLRVRVAADGAAVLEETRDE